MSEINYLKLNKIKVGAFNLEYNIIYMQDNKWENIDIRESENGYLYAEDENIRIYLELREILDGYSYKLKFLSDFDTRIRIKLSLIDEDNYFHLIPCNIHGDNNAKLLDHFEFPHLTDEFKEESFCSSLWEFRADRASHPVSILCCNKGAVGISIEPYSELENRKFIRNGVFAELPNSFGVSIGYGNEPFTFTEKKRQCEDTSHFSKGAEVKGKILAYAGNGRKEAHKIIRNIYEEMRDEPKYERKVEEATEALMDCWLKINWSNEFNHYRNAAIKYGTEELTFGRPLVEIGWTGGGPVAYPMIVAEYLLKISKDDFGDRKTGEDIFDVIVKGYNEKSGLLNDVTRPHIMPYQHDFPLGAGKPNSNVNGWWSGYVVVDCHCAYTNGSALYYLFKTVEFCEKYLNTSKEEWLETGLKVLDTICELQREDGNYGYSYSESEKKVLRWEGFAGCWFAAAMVYGYRLSGRDKYLESAKKALDYYTQFVVDLNCYGTPMDTLFSVDEEGILAYIRACRLMHEETVEDKYLDMMKDGAEYEYLWRYGFRARPEFQPLKDSWNSCGGSVTSVSNPHMHPMGVFIADDLEYLAHKTGDLYHKKRADDSISWIMQTMELYPDKTGVGRYGVLTERFCPSDGLVTERYADGTPCSIWHCYNGWAAAAALEGLCERWLKMRKIDEK